MRHHRFAGLWGIGSLVIGTLLIPSGNVFSEAGKDVTLEVLNPIAQIEVQRGKPAPRVPDLNNKTIGLYWNRKARGDVALRKVEELLKKRFTDLKFTWFETPCCVELTKAQVETLKNSKNEVVIGTTGD